MTGNVRVTRSFQICKAIFYAVDSVMWPVSHSDEDSLPSLCPNVLSETKER